MTESILRHATRHLKACLAVLAVQCILPASLAVAADPMDTNLPEASQAPAQAAGRPAAPALRRVASPYRRDRLDTHAQHFFEAAWGIEDLKVLYTASGNLIRFSYRVSHPDRAKPLGEKSYTPYLIEQRSNIVLQIPIMEKVGALRQAGVPVAGKEYWMTFSNKGNRVKVGDRVNVVIGSFHADGLTVE